MNALFRPRGAWTRPAGIWRFSVSRCSADRLEVGIRGPWPDAWPVGGAETNGIGPWDPAQRHAVLRLKLDRELALSGFGRLLPGFPSLAGELFRHDAVGPMHLSLIDGPYAGRARGMRLPTAVVALRVRSEPAVQARLGVILDVLNRQYRWGLVRNTLEVGPYRPAAVESTSNTGYARFALNEQVACLAAQDTLLLASNLEGFTNLLLQADAPGDAPAPEVEAASDPAIEAWVDLEAGGKSLRLLLTAWSLQLDERDQERAERTRARLQEAKDWVDSLAPLGTVRVIAHRVGREMDVTLSAGGTR